MKKKILTVILAAAMVLSLAACGSSGNQSGSTSNTSSKAADSSAAGSSAASSAASSSAAASSAAASSASEAAELSGEDFPEITFTYNNPRAENHYMNDYNQWYFDQLKEKANINVEAYYSNALVGATTPYTEIKDGVADFAWVGGGIEPDHFDIAEPAAYFMWGCADNEILYKAWTKAFNETAEWNGQYEGVKVLGMLNAGNSGVVTIDPVTSVDQFQGMVIRGVPSQTSLIEALGAENLTVASTEVLANMEKGTLDGAMGIGTITGFSLLEICKSAAYLDIFTPFEPELLVNENSWNKLTPAQQEVMTELSDEFCQKVAGSFDEWDQGAIDAGVEAGMTFNVFSDDELAKLQKVAYDLAMEGIETLNARGYDGQAIYDKFRECLQEICDEEGYEITEIG